MIDRVRIVILLGVAAMFGVVLVVYGALLVTPVLPANHNCTSHDLGITKVSFCQNEIDIRIFDNGTATRQGVSLTLNQWKNTLSAYCENQGEWEKYLPFECKPPYGDKIKVTDCGTVIDIRRYDGLRPTIRGVSILQHEWLYLLNKFC